MTDKRGANFDGAVSQVRDGQSIPVRSNMKTAWHLQEPLVQEETYKEPFILQSPIEYGHSGH